MSENKVPFGEDRATKSKEGLQWIGAGILLLIVSIVILSLGNKISIGGFVFAGASIIMGISKLASRR